MLKYFDKTSILLAACAFTAHIPSFAAQASAQSSISNVVFSVVDLNPSDGITPSYSFIANAGPVLEASLPSGSVASGPPNQYTFSPNAFAIIHGQYLEAGGSNIQTNVTSTSVSASGISNLPLQSLNSIALVSAGLNNNTFEAPIFSGLLLVLSPQTRLNVNFDAIASASLICSEADQLANNCSSSSFAYASFSGMYSLTTHRLITNFSSNGSVSVNARGNSVESLLGGQIWLENPNSESVIASFSVTAAANTYLGTVSAVPEPRSWISLILGLPLVGAIVNLLRTKTLRQVAMGEA